MRFKIASAHHDSNHARHRRPRPRRPQADPEERGQESRSGGLGSSRRSDLPLRRREEEAPAVPLGLAPDEGACGSRRQGSGPRRRGRGPPAPPAEASLLSYAIDVNVLLYASDASSPFARPARAFIEKCAAGPEVVCLPWPALASYLRLATHPAIFASPLTPGEAEANVDSLLALPHARVLSEADGFWDVYREV